jgi:hypothetical protein
LSREEREAAYNAARERIFGNPEKSGEATPGKSPPPHSNYSLIYHSIDTEEGQDISRSSSVSVKDRSGKRGKVGKQRRDDSESFDVRSQYTPFFPPQQQPSWSPVPQYGPMVPQYGNTMQNTYPGTPTPVYGQPPQQFHAPMMGSGMIPTYNQMPPNQLPQHPMVPNQMNQVSQQHI